MGLMGFHTPNIDRVAREGMIFIDYCAEQSCKHGRPIVRSNLPTCRRGADRGCPGKHTLQHHLGHVRDIAIQQSGVNLVDGEAAQQWLSGKEKFGETDHGKEKKCRIDRAEFTRLAALG